MKVKELLSSPEIWAQGGDVWNKNVHCLGTAIEACYPSEECKQIRELVVDKLLLEGEECLVDKIMHWNDTEGRTFEDVRSLIEDLDI